ncbi:hypothetical protein E4K10_48010 [Streptomyces sp. T1317-0309]|nr:hypothetical protein E4K10_48010 [Streptomyces sp. T1317-0309]
MATLHRAIRRDLNHGQRAALVGGERARRRYDVHLRRPKQWRNACWEADHKHIPVEVLLEGERVFPWVTWFVDTATNAITGAAITPHQPSRDAILASLRIALQRDQTHQSPFSPVGGLPGLVRIDRGSDFLSHTVASALGAFAVPVQDLPAYRPELKGTVENLNRCAQRMFFASLPGYTHAPTASLRPGTTRGPRHPVGELMEFSVFVGLLLEWIGWWNTEHSSQALAGRTPLEAWQADPTPIRDVDHRLLWAFTLEDDGRTRTLTTSGVRWNNRYYVGEWMSGGADAGTKVRVRYLPHHDDEIEVFDATTGKHLGTAHLADAATDEQRRALRRSKEAEEKRRLARALAQASRHTRSKYAAVTTAQQPKRLGSLTAAEADQGLAATRMRDAAEWALPDLIPPPPPPSHWRTPASLRPTTGAVSHLALRQRAPTPATQPRPRRSDDSNPPSGRGRPVPVPAWRAHRGHRLAAQSARESHRHDRGARNDVRLRRSGLWEDPGGQHLPARVGTRPGGAADRVPLPPHRPRGTPRDLRRARPGRHPTRAPFRVRPSPQRRPGHPPAHPHRG